MKRLKGNKTTKIIAIIVLMIASLFGIKSKDINYYLNSNKNPKNIAENVSKNKSDTENPIIKEDTEPIKEINGNIFSDISYNPEEYPEMVIELEYDKGLSTEQKEILNKHGENKIWQYYETSKEGLATRVTGIITKESMDNHRKQERPSFKSGTYIPGELVGGYYDKLNKRWTSDTKDSNGDFIKYNKKMRLNDYSGYIYNKSHLLAWSLGGDMEAHNLILGTRWQNVGGKSMKSGGMSYIEQKLRDVLEDYYDTKIFYQAVPIYKDNEIVPRGVYVKAYSINDNGETIDTAIYVFNNMEGMTINYNTGEFILD